MTTTETPVITFTDLILGVLGYTDDELISLAYEAADGTFTTAVMTPTDAIAAAPKMPATVNAYFGVCPTAGPARRNAGRGKEADVTRLSAAWVDLDIKPGACPSLDVALAIIANLSSAVGSRPSVIVYTGHGVHAYWPISDGHIVGGDISAARALLKRWGRLVDVVAGHLKVDVVDNVFDLSRVLRLPGSFNNKHTNGEGALPVTAHGDNGHPLTMAEVAERLDERGIYQHDGDDAPQRDEVSPPADWVWAQRPCGYTLTMIDGWATDSPKPGKGRNPWLYNNAIRLACAHRSGCLTEADHRRAKGILVQRFTEIVHTTEPRREPKKYEFADVWKYSIPKVAAKTDDEARAELGGHTHNEAPGNTNGNGDTAAPFDDGQLWDARQSLNTIRDYAMSCMVSPWGLLGVLIIYMLDAVPYSVALPGIADDDSPGSLNLFVGVVDPSGAGKGRIERVGERYLDRCEVSLPPGSGEGIPKMFGRRPTREELKAKPGDDNWVEIITIGDDKLVFKRRNLVITAPEVDTLTALTGRSGATLFETLRRAFSGETLGFGYADDSKRIIIPAHQYRLGLIVGIQPERSGVLLDDGAAAGGTPQRILWTPAADKRIRAAGRPKKPEPAKPYRGVWPSKIPVCDTARTEIMAGVEARAQGDGQALDGHLLFVRLKVGAALALLDGRCEVTEQDWQLADVVVEMSNRQRQRCVDALTDAAARDNESRGRSEGVRAVISAGVQQNAAADQLERSTDLIVTKVIEAGPLKPWKLKHSLNSRYRHLFDAALDAAIAAGRLTVSEGEVTTPC